ncbi:MAG: (d)CMP kinase [Verrucomicrobiota bacterium]
MSDATEFKIVAMDGGAATGKSSTSRALAERLDLMHVDTGAHYRTLTYALLKAGVDGSEAEKTLDPLKDLKIGTELRSRSALLSINNLVPDDAEIRSPEVNTAVSKFAAISAVREYLFDYQRQQAKVAKEHGFQGLIMEGRDIGSIIFPDANFRFFLFADEATRAARRAKEGLTDSIAARDKMDATRKTAPMICPEGAIRIDTGPLTLDQVVDHIAGLITEKADA